MTPFHQYKNGTRKNNNKGFKHDIVDLGITMRCDAMQCNAMHKPMKSRRKKEKRRKKKNQSI